ncbi:MULTISPECIES: NAD(P)H:quinone oxidoreductase type IV [Mesonia]|uniref:NAD(P)H dehydrogenase (Quinone) n=1 Tax=Mesonia oceanica TaxID=2687242 RepID=A0AC61YCN8_9FLAO|nr:MULTISPECIES: NAD(P)H:quinone oxidoreductase type IV [Mesonia]MAN27164.1 NAD(P)H:quinone oxidoreductase type IV [Mesonia sp.]MAQ42049.1 NAD(P)H:quinone oxidoreductase type IV [Mesonia sp.]MBJ97594.1 NAD(P)H:quinone oxidoreductase type IV [Flavobacteriaceae bacterium]VVV02154.1 NAD(P)H dehydrogenase (quinone) [Mesonia oceanica]|tara:strand:- start:32393 stop:32989 length:597 start_codon:yes stop_codon:yes gene_type:complete
MEDLKLAIIYYSATGTNYQLAKEAETAAKDLGLENIRFRRVEETVPEEVIKQNEDWLEHYHKTKEIETASVDDLDWADAIIFSFPTRYGDSPSQFKSLIDSTGGLWQNGKLVNKVVSGMTSAANPHGGQEGTLLSLYKTMMHWGAIVAAPGYSDPVIFETGGNPYGFSMVGGSDLGGKQKQAIAAQVKRTLKIAEKLK